MSLGELFKGNTDLSQHHQRRYQNDQLTLRQSWCANANLLKRIDLVRGLKGFSAQSLFEGGPDATGKQYSAVSSGLEMTYSGSGQTSSLKIMLDMDGKYTIVRAGAVAGQVVEATSGNKVVNLLNGWLTDVGTHYNFDIMAAMQRANDVQERKIADAKRQERLPK